MSDERKHPQPRALGDDPFADMDTLEWLGIESPPASEVAASEPETDILPETKVVPTLDLPDDEAERALQEWLREETPSKIPPEDETAMPNAQTQLLARLLAEQNSLRGDS